MAGDWIKMTHALPEKPEVLLISGATGLNRFDVVGRLFILWRWFDINTTNGNARGVTSVTLEACLFGYGSNAGFVAAVVEAGWLREDETGVSIVKFDEHISESAKTRGQTAKRVARCKSNASGNGGGNGERVTKGVPKEKKRREEDKDKNIGAAAPFAPPDWIDKIVWAGFEEMRRKIKKPMTDRARQLIVIELEKLRAAGHDPITVLDSSTRNSWQGVFAPNAARGAAKSRLQTPQHGEEYGSL